MAGIYIHIPFCKQKCYYCDFHFSISLKRKEEMLEALNKEFFLRKDELKQITVETIYFGGGTPSILKIDEIEQLVSLVYKNFNVSKEVEITLEANPDDLSQSKIIALSKTKINRLSIGIQSFFDDDLQFMNRAHTAKESEECLKTAKQYFKNITIDLIYGLPNMSNNKWLANLKKAFELGVPHLSCYALTVEKKTALASFIKKGKVPPVDDEQAFGHFNILVQETKKQGFEHYEISNFAKKGFYSKHNASYWQGKFYMGIGPSAHSFNGKERSWNIANNAKYIKALSNNVLPQEVELLTEKERFNEYVMTGLRTIWGVDLNTIASNFKPEYYNNLQQSAALFITKGLLEICLDEYNNSILKTTAKGKFLADGIASELFII